MMRVEHPIASYPLSIFSVFGLHLLLSYCRLDLEPIYFILGQLDGRLTCNALFPFFEYFNFQFSKYSIELYTTSSIIDGVIEFNLDFIIIYIENWNWIQFFYTLSFPRIQIILNPQLRSYPSLHASLLHFSLSLQIFNEVFPSSFECK